MREGLSKFHGLPVGPLTGIHIRASPHPVSSVRTYPFTNHPGHPGLPSNAITAARSLARSTASVPSGEVRRGRRMWRTSMR